MKTDTSVAAINKECEDLIAIAKNGIYNDASQFASALEERVEDLNKFFNEHPDKYFELARLKGTVEALAIRLEYYCSIHYNKYGDRVKLRKVVAMIFDDIKDRVYKLNESLGDKNSNINRSELIAACSDWKFMLKLFNNSRHIAFYLDDDEDKKLREVVMRMQEYTHKEY